MQKQDNRAIYIVAAIGIIPVVWLGLLAAPYADGGLLATVSGLAAAFAEPTNIVFCAASIKSVSICLLIYAIIIALYLTSRGNYRRGEEHGSAKWGTVRDIAKRYAPKKGAPAKLISRNIKMGLNTRIHQRNLNVVVVGGSGVGKTRSYAKPNIMEACATPDGPSMVILDPKGEILAAEGHLLEESGYEVRVLDLIQMEKSHCYNPFRYIQSDNDVQRLSTILFKATTPKGSQSQDPFWDNAASILLHAIMFFLRYEAIEEEQNFEMCLEMLKAGEVMEDNDEYESDLDILFQQLEMEKPDHIAVSYYKSYKLAAGKTAKSIQITLVARLEKFILESVAALTRTDSLDIPSLGDKRVALFAIIPDNDKSFNFLISMLYMQLFQQLFWKADHSPGAALKVPVHFLMDEFANVALPDDFEQYLATMRSRGVFVSIILQNITQLKALFEKSWESIMGNCDTFIYLGGNEQSSHKYVSELLGKATIDTNSFGKTKGRNGSYSTNYQNTGRELLTPDEVRALGNAYSIVFIRGEKPVMDLKYDIKVHPLVGRTLDGGAAQYQHGLPIAEPAQVKFISQQEAQNALTVDNLPDCIEFFAG